MRIPFLLFCIVKTFLRKERQILTVPVYIVYGVKMSETTEEEKREEADRAFLLRKKKGAKHSLFETKPTEDETVLNITLGK